MGPVEAIALVAEVLCEPVGGVLTHPVNYTNSTGTSNSTISSPSPSPFTGQGSKTWFSEGAWIMSILGFAYSIMML